MAVGAAMESETSRQTTKPKHTAKQTKSKTKTGPWPKRQKQIQAVIFFGFLAFNEASDIGRARAWQLVVGTDSK